MIRIVAAYVASLPPQRPITQDIEGPRLFAATGCAACHVPRCPMAMDRGSVAAYTDLLLHDMGKNLTMASANRALHRRSGGPHR